MCSDRSQAEIKCAKVNCFGYFLSISKALIRLIRNFFFNLKLIVLYMERISDFYLLPKKIVCQKNSAHFYQSARYIKPLLLQRPPCTSMQSVIFGQQSPSPRSWRLAEHPSLPSRRPRRMPSLVISRVGRSWRWAGGCRRQDVCGKCAVQPASVYRRRIGHAICSTWLLSGTWPDWPLYWSW